MQDITTADAEARVKKTTDIINFIVKGRQLHGNEKQTARALQNERLSTVFGIDNSFTTKDIEDKNTSTKKAEDLMKEAIKIDEVSVNKAKALMKEAIRINQISVNGDWTTLRERAMAYFDEYLKHPDNHSSINISGLVQFITLKLSLSYMFPHEAQLTGDSFEDIVYIGRRINTLWIESKPTEEGADLPKWEDERDLHQALERVLVPKSPSRLSLQSFYSLYNRMWGWLWATEFTGTKRSDPLVPKQNPMNLILPAYETMWRVVMRCFLEIRHRGAEQGNAWSEIMQKYLKDLKDPESIGRGDFFQVTPPTNVSPMDIVKEALRLYPPTCRVNRVFNDETYRADIEACHHSELLAKSEPKVFSPERWQDIQTREGEDIKRAEERLGFMPFAFHCPSSGGHTKGFGFKMIALLVAVLCESIDESWNLAGDVDLSGREIPLNPGRDAYEDLKLEKS